MGKKVTEKRISYGQYRLADIMVFLLIMCVCEAVNIFAAKFWFQGMLFTISVMLLVSLVMLIRWNWLGIIFPIADGLLYCWMNGASASQFAIYALGNSFICLIWFLFKLLPKEKLVSGWYFTILYAILGYLLLLLGRATVAACFGLSFSEVFVSMLTGEALNLAFAVIGLLILRLFNGMLVDQKKYLIKITTERDTVKPAEEYHWNGYTELNDDDLRALAQMDEYDRALNYNSLSLRKIKESDGHEMGEFPAGEEKQCDDLKDLSELDVGK